MKRIIEFYGGECPDCLLISPAVEKLEKEDGVEVEKLEVWHNAENKERMEALKSLYEAECDGNFEVPSFYEKESNRLLCMPMTYENLKSWVFEK